VTPSSAAS